jgi:hypothetical protein
MLKMKEAWKRQKDGSNTSTGFIVQDRALQRGIPARELEPTATYRLGVDTGKCLEGKPCSVGKFFQSGVNHR